MHKRSFLTLMATAVISAAGGLPAATAEVEGPAVTWRIATMGKPRAATTHIEILKSYVEAKTDGNFSIEIGYGTFGDSREFLDLLKIGAIQGATVQASVSADRLPLYTVLDLPFLPIEGAKQQRFLHDKVNEVPAVKAEFAEWGAMPFMSSLLPPYELMGVGEPIKSLSDLDGVRMRALGGNGDALATFGAVPSNMPPQEMYVSMERGLISAVALPYYAHVSYRTYELGDWMTTNMGMSGTGFPVVLSIEAWDSLPQQYRDLLLEAREEAYREQIRVLAEDTDTAFQTIKDAGIELIEISDADMKELRRLGARPIWDQWLADHANDAEAAPLLDFVLKTAEEAAGQ